jgi:antitoxin (DNA-binding transcriptional repressor) of toxin-antitoxin stability system
MITVAKGELKAKMLEYFRHVEKSGEELIVTDHRKPVLKIVPLSPKLTPEEVFANLRGKVKYYEDINTPTISEWGEL